MYPTACAPNPCENGATCVEEFPAYSCVCPAEYTGQHCETAVTGEYIVGPSWHFLDVDQ